MVDAAIALIALVVELLVRFAVAIHAQLRRGPRRSPLAAESDTQLMARRFWIYASVSLGALVFILYMIIETVWHVA